jgi:hypothetical protein
MKTQIVVKQYCHKDSAVGGFTALFPIPLVVSPSKIIY